MAKNVKVAILVSIEDFDRLKDFNWFIDAQGYASRNVKLDVNKWTRRYMHREVLTVDKGMDVEHKNQNKLDNRRSNLRSANRSQNMANVRKLKSKTSHSIYKGVSKLNRDNLKNKYLAYIKVDYKTYYLGYYETQEEAAHMYNQFAEQIHGEFASLNVIQ